MYYHFMTWYKKHIAKPLKNTYIWVLFPILLCLSVLWWRFWFNYVYQWAHINPLSQPDISEGVFYGRLVFYTFWSLLYGAWVYRLLYAIFWNSNAYRQIKAVIWIVLTVIMYNIVTFLVNLINNIASFWYNIIGIIKYLAPPFLIALITFIIFLLWYSYTKEKKGKWMNTIEINDNRSKKEVKKLITECDTLE